MEGTVQRLQGRTQLSRSVAQKGGQQCGGSSASRWREAESSQRGERGRADHGAHGQCSEPGLHNGGTWGVVGGVTPFDFHFKSNFEFLGHCLAWAEAACDKCWNKGIHGSKRAWRREKQNLPEGWGLEGLPGGLPRGSDSHAEP